MPLKSSWEKQTLKQNNDFIPLAHCPWPSEPVCSRMRVTTGRGEAGAVTRHPMKLSGKGWYKVKGGDFVGSCPAPNQADKHLLCIFNICKTQVHRGENFHLVAVHYTPKCILLEKERHLNERFLMKIV